MPTRIKAIVFDFGGVLLDWDPRYLYRRYFPGQPQSLEKFLNDINFSEWNAYQDQGRPFVKGIAKLSKEHPQYSHLIQAYFDNYEESIAGEISGTVKILRNLKQKGYLICGLSNWSGETFPRARKIYSLFNLFEHLVISGDVKLVKPDPAIFNLLLSRIGLAASQCLLIDDTIANIEAAKTLGFATIHFQSPHQLETELKTINLL